MMFKHNRFISKPFAHLEYIEDCLPAKFTSQYKHGVKNERGPLSFLTSLFLQPYAWQDTSKGCLSTITGLPPQNPTSSSRSSTHRHTSAGDSKVDSWKIHRGKRRAWALYTWRCFNILNKVAVLSLKQAWEQATKRARSRAEGRGLGPGQGRLCCRSRRSRATGMLPTLRACHMSCGDRLLTSEISDHVSLMHTCSLWEQCVCGTRVLEERQTPGQSVWLLRRCLHPTNQSGYLVVIG